MVLREITSFLENWAPPMLQESYDNSGLLVGSASQEVGKLLISLDVTEEVMDEAIQNQCGLIVAHHPVIFGNLKRLNGHSLAERIVAKAIKHDIALYAIHTNLDNVATGVNARICERIGIKNPRILEPKAGLLCKLAVFCPNTVLDTGKTVAEAVLEAVWEAGGGHIGQYDQCSYSVNGMGSYRPLDGSKPFIGEQGQLAQEPETRIEVVFPAFLQKEIVQNLLRVHPYEEVAYDIFPLANKLATVGSGMIGDLDCEMGQKEFLLHLKQAMQAQCVRYSPFTAQKIKKVAVCGGSGSFLLKTALAQGADALVTADFKYHQFFDAEGKILIADIGHYESEQFTIGLIFDRLSEKFPNFALLKSGVNTNPVNYI